MRSRSNRARYSDERGAALVWVLVIMTVAIVIIGAVSALAPVNLRTAKFDNDYTIALYAAESGMNEALARLAADFANPGGGARLFSGTESNDSKASLLTAVGRSADFSFHFGSPESPTGSYVAELFLLQKSAVDRSAHNRYQLTSTGQVNERTRVVTTEVSPVFWTHYGTAKDGYPVARVRVPRAANHKDYKTAELRSCGEIFMPGLGGFDGKGGAYRVEGVRTGLADCTLAASGGTYTIKNATLFLDGLNISNSSTTLEIENSTIYIDGSLQVDFDTALNNAPKTVQIKFSGSDESSIYIAKDFIFQGGRIHNIHVHGPRPAGLAQTWNYVYIGGNMQLTAKDIQLGGFSTSNSLGQRTGDRGPVIFVFGDVSEKLSGPSIALQSDTIAFHGGLYAPQRSLSVTTSRPTDDYRGSYVEARGSVIVKDPPTTTAPWTHMRNKLTGAWNCEPAQECSINTYERLWQVRLGEFEEIGPLTTAWIVDPGK